MSSPASPTAATDGRSRPARSIRRRPNDYKYTNHDKKINIYDEDKNIVGQYHPKERNRSGSFKDLHLLQEVYYNTLKGDRFGLNAWYINSNRELPMLTTDYGDETAFENRQREQTFRGVLSWDHIKEKWKLGVKGGYIHTWMAYDYRREVAPDNWASMTRSRSKINTFYGQAEAEYSPGRKWFFTSNVSVYQHLVRSEDKNIILQDGNKAVVGYDKGRVELSGSVSAKWQPVEPLGLSLVLREEMSGDKWAPLIPAFFIDGLISRKGNVMVKASVSRNYRFPTLNDLYFLPGGNPDLKNEHGFSYDAGVSFDVGKKGVYKLGGSASWFDSYIDDWIIWLPDDQGVLLAAQREESPCLRCRSEGQPCRAAGKGLADRPERFLFVAPLHQRGRKDVARRPVGGKTTALRAGALRLADRTAVMADVGVPLQVGLTTRNVSPCRATITR